MRSERVLINAAIAAAVVLIAIFISFRSSGDGVPHRTLADNNSTISLEAGGRLIIDLEANPSTGYSWEIERLDETVLQLAGEPEFESEADLEGSPGTMTFTFDAIGTGETELILIYHRSWEDADPIQTYRLVIDVG